MCLRLDCQETFGLFRCSGDEVHSKLLENRSTEHDDTFCLLFSVTQVSEQNVAPFFIFRLAHQCGQWDLNCVSSRAAKLEKNRLTDQLVIDRLTTVNKVARVPIE